MKLSEYKQFESSLKSLGIKPQVLESKNWSGELLGLVVRFSADNVRFRVELDEVKQDEPKQEEQPKMGRKGKR